MIKSKILTKYPEISHGFFNKNGGVSKGIYKSLNCGPGSKDKKKFINKNLAKVCRAIGCKEKNLVLLTQTHSSKFYKVSNKKIKLFKQKLKGDAIITNQRNLALGILTADCAPILIYDPIKKVIAAIHSGWKGAFKNINEKVIYELKKQGSKLNNLRVVVGPCISQRSYEVKKDFLNIFLKRNKKNIDFFRITKKRIIFNLSGYIFRSIKKLGVRNIEIVKKDTFNMKNNFFSSRRALMKKDKDYGRNISIIMIN